MHPSEAHGEAMAAKLNWLRAGVLGANDGIVSTAALVVGVAGATTSRTALLTAGVAGLVAGAISMGLGEYVSVSSQRDAELALLAQERAELEAAPEVEQAELAAIYEGKGLSRSTALRVAAELTEHDAYAAHVDAELHLRPDNLTNPWHAAMASTASFSLGALLPLLAVLIPGVNMRVPVTFTVVAIALAATGSLSARIGGAPAGRATLRVVLGGALAMLVTFAIGKLLGATGL